MAASRFAGEGPPDSAPIVHTNPNMVRVIQLSWIRRMVHLVDSQVGALVGKYALACLRYSLAIVFFWFGIIKPMGITPATMLVRETLSATPVLRAVVPFSVFMPVLGWWEALVGLGLLFRRTTRLAVACMMVQMASTFVPLLVVPDITFHSPPLFPTTPGFYVIKNVVLLSGGLVVASSYDATGWRRDRGVAPAVARSSRSWGVASTLWSIEPPQQASLRLLRAGLSVIFLWSGLLTLTGTAEMGTWIATAIHPLVAPAPLVLLIGGLELAIGLCLISGRTTTPAPYLALIYLLLSLVPLLLRPALTFDGIPIAISFEGAYLIKDWVLVSAVFVVDDGESGTP